MDRELIDSAWRVLPAEYREEVKEQYRDGFNDDRNAIGRLFGIDNLLSDAEGEEMLTVEANLVKELYQRAKEIEEESKRNHSPLVAAKYRGVQRAIEDLFGSKCLPDNVDSLEPKPAEPKYHIGQYVRHKPTRLVDVIEGISQTAPYIYHFKHMVNPINSQGIFESDLEPYTEPKFRKGQYVFRKKNRSVYVVTNQVFKDGKCRYLLSDLFYEDEDSIELYKPNLLLSPMSVLVNGGQKGWGTMPAEPTEMFTDDCNSQSKTTSMSTLSPKNVEHLHIASKESHYRNLSQETANCDKQFDNILKDSFSKERRLNIAAMAMQGILANPKLTQWEDVDRKEAHPKIISASLRYADALIKASEEGGEK